MYRFRNISFAVCLFIGGLTTTFHSAAQTAELYGNLFTAQSGLSQTKVYTILQDSLGFLWVGTQDGLNKYDGYSFDHFRYQPDAVSLSNNTIRCLAEGRDGVLWVGTDYGLNKLNRLGGYVWTYMIPGNRDSAIFKKPAIYAVLEDDEGQVWIRTERSLEMLDPETGQFTPFALYYDELNPAGNPDVSSMIEDRYGQIWIGTKDGLQVFDKASQSMSLYAVSDNIGVKNDNVRVLYLDPRDRIWIGTENGLYLYNPQDSLFIDVGDSIPDLEGINVNSLARSSKGTVLAGTDNALIIIQPDLSDARIYNSFNRDELHTPFTSIYTIFEDASEILWLGTYGGLVKIDQKPRKFQIINQRNPLIDGLSSYMISSIYQEENGDLWLGTAGRGLNLVSKENGNVTLYARNSGFSRRLIHDQINKVYKDRPGNLWVGTGDGVHVIKAGSKQFYRFCEREPRVSCGYFIGQQVNDIIEASNGNIWFAASNGLHTYNPVEGTIKSYNHIFNGAEMLALQDVYCILEDHRGWIWVGSSVGLIKYLPEEDKHEVFQAGILNLSSNINNNTVLSLLLDSKKQLWVGTASGLNRYDAESNSFTYFSDPVELAELRIYGIQEDGSGNLWLSTDRGLSRYDPEVESYIQYGSSDGLQNYEYLPGSCYKDREGRLYFGGISGLNIFHPDSILYNSHKPSLSFTQYVKRREQGGASKPIPLDRVSTIKLSRGVQNITIQFSALEFTAPERNRYMYRLVKKDQDGLWVHNGEQHFLTLVNQPPGTYTLSVKGSNNDLVYADDEIQIEIVIPSPFWNKTLAIIIYALLGIILITLVIQIRTRSLRRTNRMLREKEISAKEIARQREELVIKNKNITDSILYAKRIQIALLPSSDSFRTILPDSFVLFKPKDIVSGDFYWINQHGNKIYVAAVDCTGHGVPGAFVSIIGFELFRKITASKQGSNPAMILDALNENFSDIFSDGEQVYLNDGMDLSLCILDMKEKSLDYSGAFNPMYLVRNETIIEVKADRFSVGADVHFSAERKLFKSHKIYLQSHDVIYIFSDGYADQFGGPEGKKFKYRRFRHLLLTIHKLPMEKQRSILDASIEEWKGGMDQVDDILVIGIKPEVR
jgi:ligand-binding sensor domain-containing protein/serine phosphatase RsbU (regulator of sigma subunit)